MSDSGRQQIRPSISDLQSLPAEYDIVDDEDQDESQYDEEDGEPEYAPAAKTIRSLPPVLASKQTGSPSSSAMKNAAERGKKQSKTVRIEENTNAEDSDTQGQRATESRHQRFSIPLEQDSHELTSSDMISGEASLMPLIGTIQERQPANHLNNSGPKSDRAGQSRFAARRQLDKDAGIAQSVKQGHPMNKPIQSGKSDLDDEIWLDEDGNPMSAFRKNRLLKQGLRPPSVQTVSKENYLPQQEKKAAELSTNNIEGSFEALMKSVAVENEAKIAAMSADEIEHDMQDVREAFGSDMLELLKNRKRKVSTKKENSAEDVSVIPEDGSQQSSQQELAEPFTTEYIRQKYFPHEPKWVPDVLKWTQDQPNIGSHPFAYRFDFSGKVIISNVEDDITRLAGLHHHGQEQDRPGYTIQELLHLSRSTTSSQRTIALQTLGRIATNYREIDAESIPHDSADQAISREVMSSNLRGQACITALWYIEDRRPNVRQAALTCIRDCLSSRLGGPGALPLLVEVPTFRLKAQSGTEVDGPLQESQGDEERAKIPGVDDRELLRAIVTALITSLSASITTLQEAVNSLQILTQLASRSREICKIILRDSSQFFRILHKYLLRQTWSASESEVKASLHMLKLIFCLISGDRELAIQLYKSGITSKLIHFIAIQPWSAPEGAQTHSWRHMELTLRVFNGLGRYGIGADTYSNSHTAFIAIEGWMRDFKVAERSSPLLSLQFQTLHSALQLYHTWIICATDTHQTYGRHDITWSQVSEWYELSITVLQNFSHIEIGVADLVVLNILGDAIDLLQAWKAGAKVNRTEDLHNIESEEGDVVQEVVKLLRSVRSSLSFYTKKLISQQDQEKEEPFWLSRLPILIDIGQLTQAAWATVKYAEASSEIFAELLLITVMLTRDIPWQAFSTKCAIQAGAIEVQKCIAEFIYQAYVNMQTVKIEALQWLQLLSILPLGTEVVVKDILFKHLPAQLTVEGKNELKILSPFLTELTRQKKVVSSTPLRPSVDFLKDTTTLFTICQPDIEEEGEEIDPVSGAPLWKSANSELPLRKDWPFVALDDLLHSGSCAALHRPDALPEDWDANELEIVKSSLSLALRLWRIETMSESSLPSSAEVYLGIMKVFLLEEGTGDVRATGKITGRDLYRDKRISDSLEKLFKFANELHRKTTRLQNDDLEKACNRQFGTLLPFFQLFTDLMGLYDGISFGMELFGRAILIPLQMYYPVEYRRLLWIDYAHYLKTMTTNIQDAPNGIESYLVQQEVDDSVIRGMSLALLSGQVQKKRNEFLFTLATHQLASLIWTTKINSDLKWRSRAAQLTKALFQDPQNSKTSSIPHIAEMRQAIIDWTSNEQEESETRKQERLMYINQHCSHNT